MRNKRLSTEIIQITNRIRKYFRIWLNFCTFLKNSNQFKRNPDHFSEIKKNSENKRKYSNVKRFVLIEKSKLIENWLDHKFVCLHGKNWQKLYLFLMVNIQLLLNKSMHRLREIGGISIFVWLFGISWTQGNIWKILFHSWPSHWVKVYHQ